ncbi:hypothetical protein GCM10017783_01910 [Deinococcus piscis]|uniref:Uncharacterized protein n=1 Tax=Deinococcus piscis TaxID=394230 RepID=A0ABQ3JWY8_9DEIO|nr:hypothetical protein [Deinococcus piscis]GHF93652.1 hypothetical protein GCM10017783_01910 [Deinococcus piscis]
MGEAKRRKQLGLMPQTHPFEVIAQPQSDGWQFDWLRVPQGDLARVLESSLKESLPGPAGWAADYRTRWVAAGRPTDYLNSVDDVEAIRVPERLRLSGELLTGFDPRSLKDRDDDAASRFFLLGSASTGEGEEGDHMALHLREQQVAFAQGRWEPLPSAAMGERALKFLMQHPIARERGALQATYQVTHHREGLVTVDPEPPAELLGALEVLAQTLHGQGEDAWAAAHQQMIERTEWADEAGRELPQGAPAARRLTFELRERAPLNTPLTTPVGEWGELVILVGQGSTEFSPDGTVWYSYVDPSAEPTESELSEFFNQILDLGTVEVTVMADGRVTWDESEVAAEHADRLRRDLLDQTGAGEPARWAEFARAALVEAYEDTAPFLAEVPAADFPVPQGLKLDVPLDAIEDAEHPNELLFESQVTFDGKTWADIYLDELPAELLALRPQN